MDRSTKITLNEAIEKMAIALQPEHWQALVAAKGVAYPHAFTDKVRILRYLILDEKRREICLKKGLQG